MIRRRSVEAMPSRRRRWVAGAVATGAIVAAALALPGCLDMLFPYVEPIGPVTAYIADQGNHMVRRVACTGMMETVVGTGSSGDSGDGGPAIDAELRTPVGICATPTGALYIADPMSHRVRHVSATGTIITVAGNGSPGYSGDGGPAAAAQFNEPVTVALDTRGRLYIVDAGNFRIRRVDTDGTVTTVVGDGVAGDSGDGGLATAARFGGVGAVWVSRNGEIYFSDNVNHRVRFVDDAGVVHAVAGTGVAGDSGDGGPATAAQLNSPAGIWGSARGDLYIADMMNHRIRVVSSSGLIEAFAGTGTPGNSGDGGPALLAQFSLPAGVWGDPAAGLFVADQGNHHVRRVTWGGVVAPVAGTGSPGSGPDDPWPASLVALSGPIAVAVVPSDACRVPPPEGGILAPTGR